MEESKYVRAKAEDLKKFCSEVLEKVGVSPEDAEIISDSLVKSDLMGVNSHGLIRFPFYIERMVKGGTKVDPEIKVLSETAAIASLDGDNGMGQVLTSKATEMAIAKAEDLGIGFVVLKNSCHFGAAGYYALQAVEKDMIGIVWSNGCAVMAPWGGCARTIGNNPLAVAFPTGSYDPFLLDMAMSKVAGGKVRLYAKKGEKIPTDWIINKEGKVTDDPNDLPDGGALLSMGHKTYGLAMVGEILAGVLPGAGLMSQIPLWFKEVTTPTDIGHMVLVIDIKKFLPVKEFNKKVDGIIQELKSSRRAEGVDEILFPGELEARKEREQLENGLELPTAVMEDLDNVGNVYGVASVKRL